MIDFSCHQINYFIPKETKIMKNIIQSSIALIILGSLLISCTANQRARNIGGTMTIEAPAGMRVVNMTWKEGNNLWIQYEKREPGFVKLWH